MKKIVLPFALSLTLFLTACGPKKFIALPPSTQQNITSTDVHLVKAKDEMTATVNLVTHHSSPDLHPLANLIGSVTTSIINANRRAAADHALKHVRDYMGGINMNEALRTRLMPAISSTPWLKVKNFYHEKNMTDTRLRQIYHSSAADAVLITHFNYNMTPDFSSIIGTLRASLYASHDALNPTLKTKRGDPIYRTEVTSKINLTGARGDIIDNALLWEKYGPQHMTNALSSLLDMAVGQLRDDLQCPSRVH